MTFTAIGSERSQKPAPIARMRCSTGSVHVLHFTYILLAWKQKLYEQQGPEYGQVLSEQRGDATMLMNLKDLWMGATPRKRDLLISNVAPACM